LGEDLLDVMTGTRAMLLKDTPGGAKLIGDVPRHVARPGRRPRPVKQKTAESLTLECWKRNRSDVALRRCRSFWSGS
jgi:hypothetical protein